MKAIYVAFLAIMCATGPAVANPQPFFAKHCIKCHGPKKSKGKLRLDTLGQKPEADRIKIYVKISEALELNEMPPEKESRPPKAGVVGVQHWLEAQLTKAAAMARRSGGRMLIRRLNRAEYNNTIRDLFGVDIKPARVFPEDDSAHGFDNVGSALTVSPLLLEKYMSAAQFITDRTLFTDRPKTANHRWKGAELAGVNVKKLQKIGRLPPGDAGILFQTGPRPNNNMNVSSYPIGPGDRKKQPKALLPGEYVLRFKAHFIGTRATPAFRHKIYWSLPHLDNFPKGEFDPIIRFEKDGGAFHRVYITREPKVYEVRTFVEPGQVLTYNFENAPPNVTIDRVGAEYKGPGLILDWFQWQGPVFDQWPPASHKRVFFGELDTKKDRDYAAKVLERFASRAFRRPVTKLEVANLLKLFDARQKAGDGFEQSVAAAVQLVLCSPSFLYLAEPAPAAKTPDAKRNLNAYELASRLSYFLWSSMPDEPLLKSAQDGSLVRDIKVLEAHVRRMLKDPKASAMTHNFVGQWLKLRKLKTIAVDQKRFPHYSDYLKALFVRETELYFEEILTHDLSILNFIESDFMMLNDRLALHYGIKGITGHEFRKVPVKEGSHRGGLITQGSILTLTTCGTRTSPVMRGIWILETMLGTEPPPPPKEVPALTPDTKGATTIRQRLAKHREDASCARCHNKIDPLGLAMENYDVVGQWRDHYQRGHRRKDFKNGKPVNANTTLITGEKVAGAMGLREVLMKKKDRFCHSFTEKMLTYALGRGLDLGDRKTVDSLATSLKKDDYKMSNLIVHIVQSDPFTTK